MKKIIVANWKMNHSFEEADKWLEAFIDGYLGNEESFKNIEAVVCPPLFLIDYLDGQFLDGAIDALEESVAAKERKLEDLTSEDLFKMALESRPFSLGAQNCHHENAGSFTGDVSARMVRDISASYVIVGHSERRQYHFESDEMVARKAEACAAQGLVPIICVGENKEIRDEKKHLEFIYQQMLYSIPRGVKFERLVIAYEPVWSIGTGLVPSVVEIAEVAQLIKKILTEKGQSLAKEFFVLYGGSVSEENAKEILAIENVDGLLVGGASLDGSRFVKICV